MSKKPPVPTEKTAFLLMAATTADQSPYEKKSFLPFAIPRECPPPCRKSPAGFRCLPQ